MPSKLHYPNGKTPEKDAGFSDWILKFGGYGRVAGGQTDQILL